MAASDENSGVVKKIGETTTGIGPYTFVLEATHLVPKIMLTKRKTVGLRVPDHNVCRAIVSELGSPIISTSATLPDGTVLADPVDIEQHLGGALRRRDDKVDGAGALGVVAVELSGVEARAVEQQIGDIGRLDELLDGTGEDELLFEVCLDREP